MASITIYPETSQQGGPRLRAIAGDREAVGRTIGQALDALTADWVDDVPGTAVLIQLRSRAQRSRKAAMRPLPEPSPLRLKLAPFPERIAQYPKASPKACPNKGERRSPAWSAGSQEDQAGRSRGR